MYKILIQNHDLLRFLLFFHSTFRFFFKVLTALTAMGLQGMMIKMLCEIVYEGKDPNADYVPVHFYVAAMVIFLYDVFAWLTGPSTRCLYVGMDLKKEKLLIMPGKRFSNFEFQIIDMFLFLLFLSSKLMFWFLILTFF